MSSTENSAATKSNPKFYKMSQAKRERLARLSEVTLGPEDRANEWGTSWDDEIRKHREAWDVMCVKCHEIMREKHALEQQFITLDLRARREGWSLSSSVMAYGRDYMDKLEAKAAALEGR